MRCDDTFRFLSLPYVDNLLAERGIDVSFQTVSDWAIKFGRWCETSERL